MNFSLEPDGASGSKDSGTFLLRVAFGEGGNAAYYSGRLCIHARVQQMQLSLYLLMATLFALPQSFFYIACACLLKAAMFVHKGWSFFHAQL